MNALHLHTPVKVTWMNDETFHPLKALCSNEHCQFSGIKYLPFLVAYFFLDFKKKMFFAEYKHTQAIG